MSINKSQEQSVKYVGLDVRNAVFTHGQLYVAVSRVTSVFNLKVIWDSNIGTPVTKNIVYPEVIIDQFSFMFFFIFFYICKKVCIFEFRLMIKIERSSD